MQKHMHALGDVVKKRRVELGLTQGELAEKINADPRTILNIENQKGNPKMEVLFPLIRELQIDPIAIFYPGIHRDSESLAKFHMMLSQCSDDEIQSLIPICEAVLLVLREKQPIELREE